MLGSILRQPKHRSVEQNITTIGLPLDDLQLRGFRKTLQDDERLYLDSLQLGDPQSLRNFDITEYREPSQVFPTVTVLYRDVLMLFRYKPRSKLVSWDESRGESRDEIRSHDDEYLFIHCYLYPRHIETVTETRNGKIPSSNQISNDRIQT